MKKAKCKGETTEIWKDKWLPKPNTYKPQDSIRFLHENTKVSFLIDDYTFQWKRDLVFSMFTKEEVELILKIPISPPFKPDRIFWRCTSSGQFTVKSAYHLLNELEDQTRGQSSNLRTHQAPWTRLWNLNLPNATKTFLWRACLNALPTRANLKRRKVTEEPACPICLHSTETIEHTLWDCPSTRDVWALSNRKFQKASTPSPPFAEKLESLEVSLGTKELLTFAITAWNLWKRKNEVVFKGHLTHPSSVVKQSQQLVEDPQHLHVSKKTKSPSQQNNSHWEAPPQGKIKVNWDASVDKISCKVGVGVIIQDWKSQVLATLRMKQDLFPDPHMAEAFAAFQAVLLQKEDLNYTGLITADTRDILNIFNSWSTRHIVRAINVVAHALSKDALSISGRTSTFVNIPSCIQTMVS
ncbi:hypothetical protein CIPAW_05G068400 [Carya illinoinensis]|uniref:Reverse transcriptase zinc-binding domain-containing protein n=1 Tax=Carya illinoinensis TaxID=32201 RepID=A0A8T1QG08_CARIL|nr:hypothetical protein CIPAW_05G068400 [Carya illinoinensis]